ncbi:hypothetical protein H0H92_014454 [Tricholoma furcatifolium]|nr:hypothetical protein H0H92_014454 [Tricholoma furcatifolium]
MEQEQQPSLAEQRMALAAKLKRAASLPRMKDGRRPPMHADSVSEGEKALNGGDTTKDQNSSQAPDQPVEVAAEVNTQTEVKAEFNEGQVDVVAESEDTTPEREVEPETEAAEPEVEELAEEEERETRTRSKRRSRSRGRRGSKDLRAKARAAQTPTPTFQNAGDSSQDEAPLHPPLNLAPLMSPIPVASHFLELQRSRLLRSPTPLSADPPMGFPHTPISPIAPPTLEAWQKGLLRSNSAGGKAMGRNLAMQSLTGGTETYEPSGSTLIRNNTVTGTGERVAARQLMLSRLGGRIRPDPGDVSLDERSGPSPTPRRRKRRSRRGSQSATAGVSDSEGMLSTSPNTPSAPSAPLPAFDDSLLRSRSTTPFQSSSFVRDFEEPPEPPLPAESSPGLASSEPPKRRSLVIEEEDDADEEVRYPVPRSFASPSGVAALRFPHTLDIASNINSHSPSPVRGSPYASQRTPQRTPPVVEGRTPSPFATPLTELSGQEDDEEVLYPPYRPQVDESERELSWIAEPVPNYDTDPEIRMPIQESNDQDSDQPPLSPHSNDLAPPEHGDGSPRASFSSRSLIVESETSPSSPPHAPLGHLAPERESVIHTSDESTSPQTYPKRLSVGKPAPEWVERNSDNPSTWEKVIGAFSRAGSSTGRRSRTNSIVNRNRADSVNRESGASLNSAKTDKVDVLPHQAPPLMQSPSASASISSLAAHARTAPSPVPPLTSANKSKYQHAKLFPFGMSSTQDEPSRLPPASISTPDVRISANDEDTLPLSVSTSQASTASRERTLSHQTSDSHLVARHATSTPQPASSSTQRSPSQNGTYKLPMTLPGVKQWLSKNKKKKFSTAPSSPSSPISAPDARPIPSKDMALAPATTQHVNSGDWGENGHASAHALGDPQNSDNHTPSIQPRSEATDNEKTPKAKKTITIPPSEHSTISYLEVSPLSPPSRPDPFSSTTPDPSSSLSDYPAQSTSESSSTTSSQYSLGGPQGSIFLDKIDEELARGSRSRIWATSLGDPPRKLLLATPVIQVVDQNTLKDRFLFLFSDILVITKPIFLTQEALTDKDPSSRKFVVKSVVMLNQLRFAEGRTGSDVNDTNDLKQRNRLVASFAHNFSRDPESAVATLSSKFGRRDDSVAIGQLLFKTWDLDRVRLGEYLAKRTSKSVLKVFLDSFGFLGVRVDNALRVFLLSIHVPEKVAALEYLLEAFASRWYEANAKHVDFNKDHTHRFVRAIVQLNDLLHGGIAQEAGVTKVPQREVPSDEFVEAFRRYDQKSAVSDGLLRDVYDAIVHERLSQAPGSNAHIETISFKRPIPASLTWRVESEPIILRIPRSDPGLVIELFGQDLIFEPPILTFAKSPEVSFRVKSNVLGSRSVIMRRAGPNAVKYTGLPLSTTVLIERAVMRYTFQIAFNNYGGLKRRYMFSVDDSLLRHQWAVHIRRQMEKVQERSSKASSTKFRRAAEMMSFSILQETLLGHPVVSNAQQKQSSRGVNLNGGPRMIGSNGFQLAALHVRSTSRSKFYHSHGAGKNELDFSQPLRLHDEDGESERPEGHLWSAKELETLCEQNGLIASLVSDLQAATSEQGDTGFFNS